MTTDRALIEAAARAAGIELEWSSVEGLSPRRLDDWMTWNPRTSGQDSFDLAARLRITVEHNTPGEFHPWVCASCDLGNWKRVEKFIENVPGESQRADAMMLAILRCAAAQAPEVVA